jgi:predicted ATPase/DNA-binding winged helix-turn-helix (wHTH) protein
MGDRSGPTAEPSYGDSGPAVFVFGDVEVDIAGRELHRGGGPVAVEPQVFDVLVHLIHNRDRVVSKEELLDEVWQHRFVTESALSSRIKSVRQAIGDNGREQRMIRTVHGRGYRFVAAVDELTAGASAPGGAAVRLPVETTPFVGRADEIRRLAERVSDPSCRLLTIMGPGGMGKTRLAVEVAREGRAAFSGGVVFVPLAPLSDASELVFAIAGSLDLPLDARVDPVTQLLARLHGREILLLLDNFEHLGATHLLARILESCPRVTLLLTSRERVNLRAEWVHELGGLSVERGPEGAEEAVELFVRASQRFRSDLTVDASDEGVVRRICRLVGGMPLALELAAGWSELLSAEEIAAEIERDLAVLESDLHDVPERQRSMRAVFEASWERLTPEEQEAFGRLSVLRGGFTRSAGEAVAGAGLATLRALSGKSMVATTGTGRYVIHELLRQYGEAKLESSGCAAPTRRSHSEHFLGWLEGLAGSLKGGRQLETMDEIAADLDNVRIAWHDAAVHRRADLLHAAVEPLWLYFDSCGNVGELGLLFQDVEASAYRGLVRACHGMVRAQEGALEEGWALLVQALDELDERAEEPDGSSPASLVCLWLGWTSFLVARNEDAEEFGRRGLARYAATGDPWGIARCQYLIGNNDTALGRLESAERSLETCRSTALAIGDRRTFAMACRNLSILAGWFGDHEAARSLIDESLSSSRGLRDRLGTAYAMRELGKLQTVEGEGTSAVETLTASIAITDDIGADWESAATANDLGNALAAVGEADAAERALSTCLAAAEASSNRYYEARCIGDLGALALARGELGHAEQLLVDASNRWRKIGHEPYLAWTLTQLGHAAAESARLTQAARFYDEAVHLSMGHRLAPFAIDVLVGVATLGDYVAVTEREAILQLASHHPAATSATRQRARARLGDPPQGPSVPDLWRLAATVADRLGST